MSKDKGIFEPKEGFASERPSGNPFDFGDKQESNPFSSSPSQRSPFASTGEGSSPPPPAPSGGFSSTLGGSPFGEPPGSSDPFDDGPDQDDGPFAVVDEERESKPAGGPPPLAGSPPPVSTPAIQPVTPEVAEEKPERPAPATSVPAASSGDAFGSDSSSIRQLELRAIFGVDRELSASEILDRAKGLPGIRELARVQDSEVGALDALKRLVGGLNFGGGPVRLTCGGSPIEFIREGSTVLAVQNDGSFAPGVRETLMIVARELSRM